MLKISRIIGVDIIEAAVLKRPPIVILVIGPPVLFRQVQVCFAFRQGLSPAFPAAKVRRPIVVDVEIAPVLKFPPVVSLVISSFGFQLTTI